MPGEIVEVYRAPLRGGERDPREVVETYRQRDSREVVESYRRPVPVRRASPAGNAALRSVKRRGAFRGRRAGLYKFLICVAVLAGLAAGARAMDWFYYDWYQDEWWPGEAVHETETAEITIPGWPVDQGAGLSVSRDQGEPLTAQEVYRLLNPAVVTVQCATGEGISVGTGVIFSEDGYIITNHHVVRGGSECYVTLDTGQTMEVCFVAGDEDSDLAVLKVPPRELRLLPDEALPYASFGDSEKLVVGDPVYAIGAPRRLRGTLTNGIISAIDRDVEVEGRTMTLLQTNAALNSGNSGGPLINDRGRVIGINVAKYMSGQDSVEGLGFAIPSAHLERIVNDLLKWGEVQPEPRLGIQVITDSRGLLVDAVEPDTAAEKAGVRAGDYIVAAQGREIANTQDLFRVRRTLYVGDELALTLLRNGETVEVTLELEEAVG